MAWTTALCVVSMCGRQLLFVRAQLENTRQSTQTHQMRVFFCLLHLLHLWFSDNFRVLVRSHEPSAWWLLGEKFACRRGSCRGAEGKNKSDKSQRAELRNISCCTSETRRFPKWAVVRQWLHWSRSHLPQEMVWGKKEALQLFSSQLTSLQVAGELISERSCEWSAQHWQSQQFQRTRSSPPLLETTHRGCAFYWPTGSNTVKQRASSRTFLLGYIELVAPNYV